MASTQELTKLPVIQYTGMDYSTVISEIKSIIDNNKNWKSNWTQFYSSEAGTMLVQLMAWICDNLAVRQDLLYNEGFLSTAQSENSKYRLLQQIGHFLKGTNGAVANISVSLEQPTGENIYLSNHREGSEIKNISSIKNKILRFRAPDINGKEVSWEVLRRDDDGNILYTEEVSLLGNATYYETGVADLSTGETYQLTAIQGETKYFEFVSNDEGGVTFNLGLKECDTDTIAIYDIEDATQHIKVNSFQDLCASTYAEREVSGSTPCFIFERNDDGYLQIRYPSETLINNNSIIKSHAYKPGKKIGVFVRTSGGTDGNILPEYFEAKATVKTESGGTVDVVIKNEVSAFGGRNSETLDDAVKTAPLNLRTNNRAVTIEDFDKVLQQNSFVLNSKSYSPYNEPEGFENYYGRKIYPHETFGFISSNKNFADIPIESLNYFPWVDTTKEHVLNEYYNYFNSAINQAFNADGNNFFGSFISKTVLEEGREFNDSADKGLPNNWVIKDKAYEICNNATIYQSSSNLYGTIENELAMDDESKFMEVKVHTDKFEGLYIKNISNDLFVKTEDNSFTFKTNDNIVLDTENYHASFTSGIIYDEYIDVRNYSNITVVFDDNISLTVDLLKELKNAPIGATELSERLDKLRTYYLKLTNDVVYDETLIEDTSREYLEGTDIAKYRRGILELCYDAYDEYVNNSIENAAELARVNNTIKYLDFGLQVPECYLTKNVDGTIDVNDQPDILVSNGFYRININGTIYGFWIDEKTLLKAEEYYTYNATDEDGNIYNIFNHIDNGRTLNNVKFNVAGKYGKIEEDIRAKEEERKTYYNEKFEELRKKNVSEIEADELAKAYAQTMLDKEIEDAKKEYEVSIIDVENGKGYDLIDSDSVNFSECIRDDGTIWLTLDRFCALLAYLFSAYNPDTDVVFRYDEEKGWIGIDNRKEHVEGGHLRVSYISRNHCCTSTHLPNDKFSSEDYTAKLYNNKGEGETTYFQNREFDIRLDYIISSGDDIGDVDEIGDAMENAIEVVEDVEFSIRSVAGDDVLNDRIEGLTDEENKEFTSTDLFEALFGGRKIVESYTTPNFTKNDLFQIVNLDGYDRFIIQSPRVGFGSTLEIYGDGELKNSIINKTFDCPYVTAKSCSYTNDNGTFDYKWFTERITGIRKLEMFVDKNTQFLSRDENLKSDVEVVNGDFIFVDNDINLVNTPSQILLSYKLSLKSTDGKLPIGQRDNFYYVNSNGDRITYEDYCKSKGIEPMISIEGGVFYTDDSTGTAVKKIDVDMSKWSIKLTRNPYETTNSYYAISENSLDTINVIGDDNVSIVTAPISPVDIEDENFVFEFRIDSDTFNNTNTDKIKDIRINFKNTDNLNGPLFLNSLMDALQDKRIYYQDGNNTANIYNLRNVICRYEKDDQSRIVFTNIKKNNGNIVFRYPAKDVYPETDTKQADICKFYKMLLGTNLTNPTLYKLYPQECFDKKNIFTTDVEGEFYYAPFMDTTNAKVYDLKFKYRIFETENIYGEAQSRYADYYIEARDAVSKNGNKIYEYYLVKTDDAEFPDIGFYLHFVHDRRFLEEPTLEENVLQRYLNKYMIAGTEFNILKPCFRSFDIEAKVYYNANFIEKNIRENITNALNKKYQIKNISNVKIDNKIYLSDIMKDMMGIDGVEHVKITYFGLDSKKKTAYPSQSYYLKLDSDESFYTMLVLANTKNGHGLNIVYEKNEE